MNDRKDRRDPTLRTLSDTDTEGQFDYAADERVTRVVSGLKDLDKRLHSIERSASDTEPMIEGLHKRLDELEQQVNANAAQAATDAQEGHHRIHLLEEEAQEARRRLADLEGLIGDPADIEERVVTVERRLAQLEEATP